MKDHNPHNQSNETLYGRHHDLSKLSTMLQQPEYRLISLVGLGGIGKTHIAKQIVPLSQNKFKDGAYFISLQSITDSKFLLQAIMESIGQGLLGTSDPKTQVCRYLKDKHMLLVLDNFEHLMDATDDVVEILENAPHLKILLTSREVLNVSQEWVWTLTGLGFPKTAQHHDDSQQYSAIEMFTASARHIDPSFDLDTEYKHVIRLCQLVDGIPLALKIASSWLRSLTCEQLVEEISQSLDMLSTRLRDVPDHHRSIRTVFDHSWLGLSEEEQRTIKYLSVFRGSFSREAAHAVSNASLHMLTALIEKSLLNIGEDGRYSLHALLRQYIHEKLEADPNELEEASRLFTLYYGNFIANLYPGNINERQYEITRLFTAEIDNVREAWALIPTVLDIHSLRKVITVAGDLYQMKTYYQEGLTALNQLRVYIQDMPNRSSDYDVALIEVISNISWLYIRLGKIQQADELLQQAMKLSEQHSVQFLPALGTDPRVPLAMVRIIQGHYDEALSLAKLAIDQAHIHNDLNNEATGWYIISSVALARGHYDEASDAISQSLDLIKQTKEKWFAAYLFNQQGQIAIARGEYATAQRYFEESFDLREGFNDPESSIAPLTFLAQIAMHQANFERAITYFQKSMKLSHQLGDKGWWIKASEGLGNTYTAMEKYQSAHQHLVDALLTVVDLELPSLMLQVLGSVARFMIETGAIEEGLTYSSLIFNHPLTENEARELIETTLIQYQDILPPAQYSARMSKGKSMNLDDTVKHIKQTFPFYTWDKNTIPAQTATPQPLIEPLTDRELEVLHLLAQGFSNTEIADQLIVTVGTVKTHNHNIFGKLGIKNRVQAVRKAQEINLL